jgi:hypothetical protein
MVIAGALVLILIAVPLYLLRRPSGTASGSRAGATTQQFGGVVRAHVDAGARVVDVVLGPVRRVRCGAAPNQTNGEGGACDALPALEAALRQSIQGSLECAPRSGKEGSINYVLEVDFTRNRLHVFAGKSGNWRGARARRAASCVLRSLPAIAWANIPHQHAYYAIAILATYPAADALETLPTFE